jgi:beta-glucosidase
MPTPFAQAADRVRAGADARQEARELVAQMTLAEKLGCLDGDTPFWEGVIDGLQGGYYKHTWPAAAVPRLGIPGIQFSDGPRGVVIDHATAFPVSMARGASFDVDLERRVGDAIGRELQAVGATYYGGVCVNLLRHPAWGRAQETYGEDPFHVGEMGAALTRGVQRYVMACVKHFACNSMENARFKVDVAAGERPLHEVYLPHFKRVVDEGVASVMSAYNSLNGEWCGENRELLTTILRDEWGFEGFVISDFQFGLRAAVKSVEAGLDIEMPYMQQRMQHVPKAVADDALPVEVVDRCVERIVATLLRFAHVFDGERDRSVLACDAHRALAREAAQKSFVLLRNEGDLLPLDPSKLRRIAVIGALAAKPNLGDGGSSDVHPPHVVTPLEGLRDALPDTEIVHVDGCDLAEAAAAAKECEVTIVVVGYTKRDEGEYIDMAGVSSLFHLFPPMTDPGINERLQKAIARVGETLGGGFAPGGDRARVTLSETDENLIEAIAAANPRTIVAVMGGSAVVMERWRLRVPAILLLWYPGMEGGHALADVLLGKAEPGGRLPFAIPTAAEHLPHFDRDAEKETYDLWHGQWKLDRDGNAAAYPFGFGLSYTTFTLSEATVISKPSSPQALKPRERVAADVSIHVTVTNEGARPGADVVQVYGGLPSSRFERPRQRLVGFARVELAASESRKIAIPISLGTLAARHQGKWVVEPGRYELRVARCAHDSRSLELSLEVD